MDVSGFVGFRVSQKKGPDMLTLRKVRWWTLETLDRNSNGVKKTVVQHPWIPITVELPMSLSASEAEDYHLRGNHSAIAATVGHWRPQDDLDRAPIEEILTGPTASARTRTLSHLGGPSYSKATDLRPFKYPPVQTLKS